MASIAKPLGTMAVDDPFVSPSADTQQRHRYSAFNSQQFSLYSNGSPSQVKRALEAHLSETKRRLNEASNVGTVLLKQQQELQDRIREIDDHESHEEITPQLRQKLDELEREVGEVSRETARIFVPKSRVPSGESADASESVVLSSQAQHSPSKIHAPSRKLRNQPATRSNDVKLATELSDALLTQLRDLQAAYAEKDDAWKEAMSIKRELELDGENMRQRLRALDDSEQRFKDENWTLETQLHDLSAAQKEAADREQKLSQTLNSLRSEQASVQREYEELKQAHSKLADDHATARKLNDAEVSTLRRNATSSETEMASLQKKVEDLTTQNKELAKAFAARHREAEIAIAQGFGNITGDEDDDQITPEPSPPPSPSKATPRHGALESETLKSSLLHAQRQIQHLKNNIHREKTEKFELKRLLQESRDELESKRRVGDAGAKKKNPKQAEPPKKQVRSDRLGAARDAKDEILMEDQEWEDQDTIDTPSKAKRAVPTIGSSETRDHSTDAYVTATEGSDAFETANEQEASTETDAFQTTVETLDGDSEGDLTETEKVTPVATQIRKKTSPMNRYSFQSTASTSGDEVDDEILSTPLQGQQPRFKLRLGRGGIRKSSPREEATPNDSPVTTIAQDSPASTSSASGTPGQGRSLFAELGDLSDGETEQSVTPQSVGARSLAESPELSKRTPLPSRLRAVQSFEDKPSMVDSSTMTESPGRTNISIPEVIGAGVTGAAVTALIDHKRGHEVEELEPADDEVKGTATRLVLPKREVEEKPKIILVPSVIVSQYTDPYEHPVEISEPAILTMSTFVSQQTKPSEPSKPAPLQLTTTTLSSQHIEPEEGPRTAVPVLDQSEISSQDTEPLLVVDDSVFNMKPSPLSISQTYSQETTPYEPAEAPDVLTAEQKDKSSDSRPTSKSGTPVSKGSLGLFGSMFRRGKHDKNEPIIVAEDMTSQPDTESTRDVEAEAPVVRDSRVPFQTVDGNAQIIKPYTEKSTASMTTSSEFHTLSESTQTMLSAMDIDKLFKANASRDVTTSPTGGILFGSSSPRKAKEPIRRPGSSGSNRSTISPPPPLPAEAKQVIAAASQRSSVEPLPAPKPASSSMGPPIMPASAYNRGSASRRPRTPVGPVSSPSKGKTVANVGVSRSGVSSRRSSVSSFASELDQRFNIGRPHYGHQPGTDPRMIQALTQTMIGEFLWKYTRKPGRDDFSNTRHRRYFWVHPYTRTLYWSEKDPSSADRSELRAKSVPIESVRVVTDDNPNPPGLYHKSIIVHTPGRPLKFTAATSQRHETWFNALAYLLQRTDDEDEAAAEDTAEYNPQVRSNSRATGRSRVSVASYSSRTSAHNISPGQQQYPTLRPTPHNSSNNRSSTMMMRSQSTQAQGSMSSRISSVFRTPQHLRGQSAMSSVSSRHSRHDGLAEHEAENEENEPRSRKDSAEEARRTVVAGERHGHGMENVRACCDGKCRSPPAQPFPPLFFHTTFVDMTWTNIILCLSRNLGKHDVGSLSRTSRYENMSRSKRSSLQPSISTTHSRKRSADTSHSRHLEMDPANLVP
jgi:predicted  nucleic acid-binding Zn-ribbon protein